MPDERVALDAHSVRLGEGDELVRGLEPPLVLGKVDRAPLHRVLGRDRVELAHEGGAVGRVALEEIRLDGGPDRDVRRGPQGTAELVGTLRFHQVSGWRSTPGGSSRAPCPRSPAASTASGRRLSARSPTRG